MTRLAITVDLDWACEAAIEDTLGFFQKKHIPLTVFATHRSSRVEAVLGELEVGLHPYFGNNSSHGSTIDQVVRHVLDIPHNLPAYRCHQFATCNGSREALAEAGMQISSNVCTEQEVVPPFVDRFGLTEIPIFMEDGGYLWRKHPVQLSDALIRKFTQPGTKVIIVHPMHFAVNTPHFSYMTEIKQSVSRSEWNNMSTETLSELRWQGRGIRDLLIELVSLATDFTSLGAMAHPRTSCA